MAEEKDDGGASSRDGCLIVFLLIALITKQCNDTDNVLKKLDAIEQKIENIKCK